MLTKTVWRQILLWQPNWRSILNSRHSWLVVRSVVFVWISLESPLDLVIASITEFNWIGIIRADLCSICAQSSFYKLNAFYVRFGWIEATIWRRVISWRMSGQLLSVILFPALWFWEEESGSEHCTVVCHQSSEVWPTKQQGGKLVRPGWSRLAPAGPRWPSCWPGWPPATCLGQGKPPHQPVLTQCSSRQCKLVRKAPVQCCK